MNILLIRSDVKLAGPAKLMHVYAGEMRKRGHTVIFASGGGSYLPTIEADGFRHVMMPDLQVQKRSPLHIPKLAAATWRVIRENKINVVNSFNAHAGIIAAAADPVRRIGHVNTVLGTGKERANRLLPGRIIAVSNHVKDRLLAAGVKEEKIAVVYNSTLDDRFFTPVPNRSSADGQGSTPVHLVSVAVFTGQKGHEKILPLVARLAQEGLNVRLTLVGDGPTRETCKSLAKDLGIAELVTFTGALANVVPSLDAADLFVHLPDFETFGIVLAEAMARGLPAISLKVGGIPEVVLHEQTGLLADGDGKNAYDLLKELVVNPQKRLLLGRNARKRAEDNFEQSNLGDAIERLYLALSS